MRYARLAVERLEDRMAPAIYTVNSVGDQPDPTPNDGIQDDCDPNTPDNQYTLRGAIQTANSHANAGGPDEIRFNLVGQGPFTIKPASDLPNITEPVVIDGYSQPGTAVNTAAVGFNGKLLIELDGTNAGVVARGLKITTKDSTVKGLVINKFHTGIWIDTSLIGRNTIVGNFIGTDTTGKVAKKNFEGIVIRESKDNTIGGANAADRNIISGNDLYGIDIGGGQ